MGQSLKAAHGGIAEFADDGSAWFDLGMRYSSGGGGTGIDLVEAHKWFNLAAMLGLDSAQAWRSEIAADMTAAQIAAAQKAARAFLSGGTRAN